MTFLARVGLSCLGMLLLGAVAVAEEDPIFSGPQPTEPLPALKVRDVQWKGKTPDSGIQFSAEPVEWIAADSKQPTLLIFVHELTRPGLGLGRALAAYGAELDGVFCGLVFLTDDGTSTEQWMKRAQRTIVQIRQKTRIGISVDGQEGPGAYGLNRNVQLTVLVAKGGKTTANFALVQPSVEADTLKIAKAVAAAAGAKPPTKEDLLKLTSMGRMARGKGARDKKKSDAPQVDLRPILAPLLNKQLEPAEVDALAAKVQARAEKEKPVRDAIGRAASAIVKAGRLENYGTPAAQKHLKKWAEQWGSSASPKAGKQPPRKSESR